FSSNGGVEEFYNAIWFSKAPGDIIIGEKVMVWFDVVAESYPGQSEVKDIVFVPSKLPEGAYLTEADALYKVLTSEGIDTNQVLAVKSIEYNSREDNWNIELKDTLSDKVYDIMVEDKKEMVIKAENQDINYMLTERPFTSKEDFKKAYLEIDREDLIYAPRGSKITLDLKDQNVKANIKAYWINKEGVPNYNDSSGAPLSMDVDAEETGDSKYEFTVERLLQAGLSSYYEENEKIMAGYVVELQKDDETQYCFFMLQIDMS
ncbi:MAG: DUF3221 domain-containing protein, partial [Clostridiaceae bacterium]|nr:DUF3221 domain-containing protein [Clostridiaceae bacterium]